MFEMSAGKLKMIREAYPVGCVIECLIMDDPHPIPNGTLGTVRFVDDEGQIHVDWENGRGLALIPGHDVFRKAV